MWSSVNMSSPGWFVVFGYNFSRFVKISDDFMDFCG